MSFNQKKTNSELDDILLAFIHTKLGTHDLSFMFSVYPFLSVIKLLSYIGSLKETKLTQNEFRLQEASNLFC